MIRLVFCVFVYAVKQRCLEGRYLGLLKQRCVFGGQISRTKNRPVVVPQYILTYSKQDQNMMFSYLFVVYSKKDFLSLLFALSFEKKFKLLSKAMFKIFHQVD